MHFQKNIYKALHISNHISCIIINVLYMRILICMLVEHALQTKNCSILVVKKLQSSTRSLTIMKAMLLLGVSALSYLNAH